MEIRIEMWICLFLFFSTKTASLLSKCVFSESELPLCSPANKLKIWAKSTGFIHFSCYGVSKLQRKDGFIWFSCNNRPFERDQEPVPCISQLPYYGYPKVHKELLSRNRLASLT